MNALFGLKVQVCVGETMMLSIGVTGQIFKTNTTVDECFISFFAFKCNLT